MRYEPTLIVTRVVVKRVETPVYDERFHAGVNVIRGENSSGKSTVLNFIFYGLGGNLTGWSGAAKLCSSVTIEASINGSAVTLSREISDSNQQSMEIFGGDYEAAQKAPKTQWVRFPYRSTADRESFSQALFRVMKIPEVSSDLSGHITMHQILRLLYADQLSPIEHIFRFEAFDRADLRDTVGRLLCGAYDSALYDNEQRVRELTKEHDAITAQLRSIYSVLGSTEQGFTPEWLVAEKIALEKERSSLNAELEVAERNFLTRASDDKLTLSRQDSAYKLVQDLQVAISRAQRDMDALNLNIVDSDAFIRSLKNKLEALTDTSRIVEHIGEVQFQSCPACYAVLADKSGEHVCRLCKTPFDSVQTRSRISALIIDTGLQITQSEELQEHRIARLKLAEKQAADLKARWVEAAAELAALQRLPSTESRAHLRELHRRAGYMDRQIEDLNEKAKLSEAITSLNQRKGRLNDEIGMLKSRNEALRAEQKKRLEDAFDLIAGEVKVLLSNDLRRQDIFEDPKSVSFTFGGDEILVDNENYFSASSRAILKSSFCLGFLAAATKSPFFRHPRFCMIDTHENMGVEAIRSQNFQLQMLRISQESKVEHQIIYATAMIEPQLEEKAYTVGAFSTNDDRTLDIISK